LAPVDGKTPDYPYNSDTFLTYCIPSIEKTDQANFYEQLKDKFLGKEGGQIMVGITHTWKSMLATVATGVVVSIIFMWFMSNCSGCLAKFIVIALLAFFFGGGGALIFFGLNNKVGADGEKTMNEGMVIAGCILILFGLCTICVLWCNRKSLETAIAIVNASADF